jgi:hypothetical protein
VAEDVKALAQYIKESRRETPKDSLASDDIVNPLDARRPSGALATEKLGEETKKVVQCFVKKLEPPGLCGSEDGGV